MEIGLPNAEGVLVNRIAKAGAASDAGLEEGDVIIGLNGTRVRSTSELQEYVGRYRPGDKVALEYWRKGKKNRISLTLKDGNNNTGTSRIKGDELDEEIGVVMRDLTPEERRTIRIKGGAIVTSIRRGSIVFETNMQPGFVITSVNGDRVSNAAEAVEAIKNAYNSLTLDGYYEGEPDLYSYRFKKNG